MNKNWLTDRMFTQVFAESEIIGAGNLLFCADQVIADKDRSFIFFDVPYITPKGEKLQQFSLRSLMMVSELVASWYFKNGIKPRDVVAIYMNGCIDYFIHYFALTSLGAIPLWINEKLSVTIAGQLFDHVKIVGIMTDESHYQQIKQSYNTMQLKLFDVSSEIRITDVALPPNYPYQHYEDDPVLICHSSGTTGIPKTVFYQHKKMLYAVKQFLLHPPEFMTSPTYDDDLKLLSFLPSAHHASLTHLIRALLTQVDFMYVADSDPIHVVNISVRYKNSRMKM